MNRSTLDRLLAIAATIIVAGAVATAIVQNPPSLQRNRSIDENRVNDLTSARRRIEDFYHKNEKLPDNLAALCEQCATDYKDPETGTPYGYEKTGDRAYRLCATFATDNRSDPRFADMVYMVDWRHEAGPKCFNLALPLKPAP